MILGPRPGPVDDAGLASAYPWPAGRDWVRAMMVTSLDGGYAGPDGRSGSISSPADRAVLTEVRRLADAVLIGAGTFRAERYRPMMPRPDAQAERRALGQAEAPAMVIVSPSLDLPWDEDLFTGSAVRPWVVTTPAADAERLRVAAEHAHVVVLSGDGATGPVDPVELLTRLRDAGLRRVVCEGGPTLLAALAAADALDEADLSISPLFAAGPRPPGDAPLDPASRFRLEHVIADEGFLFTRYLRARP